MKITQEHYATMLNTIAPLACNITAMRFILSKDLTIKDVEKRLRWDLSYKAGLTPFLCDTIYQYADDSHIDTALKSIVKELESN
jgi:hypothetical protein